MVACSKDLSIHIVEGNTPCDLSVADNTVLGVVSVADITALNSSTSYGSFETMQFQLEYVDGCFTYDIITSGFGCPGLEYTTLGHEIVYNNGGSFTHVTQSGSDRSNVVDAPGCPSQAADCSFVSGVNLGTTTHQDGAVSLRFSGWGGYAGLTRHNGSPNPEWRLRRVRKFAVSPAARLRVQNYSLFAAGRWTASHGGNTTSPLAYNATSGQVQTALNNLASIIGEGGVTVSGSLAAGWQVTWNLNGARALLTAAVTTLTFAPLFAITENTPGNAGTPEVQTILLTLDCPTGSAGGGAEWDGTMPNRTLLGFTTIEWKADPVPGNLSLNNGKKLYTAEVRYSTSLGGLTTTGCGWIFTVGEMTGANNFVLLYQGICGTGSTGSGQYTRNDSVDVGDGLMCQAGAGPASVVLEVF